MIHDDDYPMRTADIKFVELCDEIDRWKAEAKYWKEMFEQERDERTELLNQNMLNAKKGVANALMLALHVKDDEEGNLVIDKDSRKELAESFK